MDPNHPARRRARHLAWLVVAVLLVAGACTSGSNDTNSAPSNSPPTPAFAFRLVKVAPVSATSTDASKLIAPARTAAQAIKRTMDQLYTDAYLVPANWGTGSYADVWPLFSGGAVAGAKAQADSLTAGVSAGTRWVTIEPATGNLEVRVLMDRQGQPALAVATARFRAVGTGRDGTRTSLTSDGRYILRGSTQGWRIVSFSVDRTDRPMAARPTPSGSPTVATS